MNRYGVVLGVLLSAVMSTAVCAQSTSGVDVWLTTADRTSLLAMQDQPLPFGPLDGATPVIEVTPAQRFQSMQGFGFALTGGSAELLMKMTPAARHALLVNLFGTGAEDVGVSYLRVSIGASDMNEHVFTYDDLRPGETDPKLSRFSLGPDLQDVVPVLKEILRIDPRLTILASPWSAPSWMKTNDLPRAGSLKPEFYAAYADYFVRYLNAMQAQGIHIAAVTMQNEPLNPHNTPSMVMTSKEEGTFLATALGPALHSAGLKTDVILYDHNLDVPEYATDILANPQAAQYASGSGFHLYAGSIAAMTQVHDAFPAKSVYFTEQMTTQQDTQKPLRIAESVSRLMVGAPRNWSRNVLLWNLAADPRDGPHTSDGGCPVCQGAITLDGDKVTRNLAYYTVAQASKFVRPGSVRIASTPLESLPNVAYFTPDHRSVLLVANPGMAPMSFGVKDGARQFMATLGAGDVATYIWRQ
jgi:glucosylceramidase